MQQVYLPSIIPHSPLKDLSLMQELDPLATLPRLESLSLLDNEVTKVKHYRSATAQPAVHCLVSRLLQLALSYLPARPTLELAILERL